MLFNTKTKRIIISIILFLLTAIALSSSVTGWFYGVKTSMPDNFTYYQGFKTAGFAGMVVGSIGLFFAIIFLTTEIASDNFLGKHKFVLYVLMGLIVMLLIPSLTLGLLSYLEINDVWVRKN